MVYNAKGHLPSLRNWNSSKFRSPERLSLVLRMFSILLYRFRFTSSMKLNCFLSVGATLVWPFSWSYKARLDSSASEGRSDCTLFRGFIEGSSLTMSSPTPILLGFLFGDLSRNDRLFLVAFLSSSFFLAISSWLTVYSVFAIKNKQPMIFFPISSDCCRLWSSQ